MGVAERREREKLARIDLILNSARELFNKKGFENVSMADVAAEAEVAKGTVYIYFQSKQEILYSILEPLLFRFCKDMTKCFAGENEPADQALKKFVELLYDFYIQEPDCHHLLARYTETDARKLLSTEKLANIKNIMRNNLLIVAKIVENGIKQGIFRDTNSWVFAITFWNLFYSTLQFQENRIESGGKDHRRATIDYAMDLLMNGLKKR